jgi:bacterioferritin-associated ferredoxin
MVVCHCRGVSDRQVRAAIEAGARTVAEVGARCGAAQECGGCRFTVHDLLAKAPAGCPLGVGQDGVLTVTAAA